MCLIILQGSRMMYAFAVHEVEAVLLTCMQQHGHYTNDAGARP